MRCLIPVEQEKYPKNALNRASICDEVILLYIVEKRLIEKVKEESSYILPSYALEELEKSLLDIQRREAERIKNSIAVPVELKFVVGDFYESVEAIVVKEEPDLIMTDFYTRAFLRFPVRLWIDRGGEIKEATFIIRSLRKIKKIGRDIEFARELCRRLGAKLYLQYAGKDEEGKNTLRAMGELVDSVRGELIILQKEHMGEVPRKNVIFL